MNHGVCVCVCGFIVSKKTDIYKKETFERIIACLKNPIFRKTATRASWEPWYEESANLPSQVLPLHDLGLPHWPSVS